MIQRPISLVLAICLWTSRIHALNYNFGTIGCYSSLDGWKKVSSNAQNTPGSCGEQCGSDKFFALSGESCLCGGSMPSDSLKSASATCGGTCAYDSSHSCGGDGFYFVYSVSGDVTAAEGSTSDSASRTSTSPNAVSSGASRGNPAASANPSAGSSILSSDSASSQTSASAASSGSNSGQSASKGSAMPGPSSTSNSSSSSKGSTTSSSAATNTNDAGSKSAKKGANSISGGAIAGIVVGSIAGLLAIAGLVVLPLLWRNRNNKDEFYSPQGSPVNFKNDLISYHNPYPYEPPRPLVDPRLNPTMLGDPRISIASLADARDYSRQVLTVANPDEKA